MKLPHLLLSGVAAVAFALPVAVVAQTAPAAPPAGAQAGHHGPGMMRMFKSLNLSMQQRQQIHSLMQQFHAAHPRGSAPDPAARKQLHQQIMAVLTPQQQAQFKAEMRQRREQWKQRHAQNGAFPATTPTPGA